MNKKYIRNILENVRKGNLSIEDAVINFKYLPYENLGYAMIDHHRGLRGGHPETIFALGKTIDQIVGIAQKLAKTSTNIMVTKANPDIYEAVKFSCKNVIYYEEAKIVVLNYDSLPKTVTRVLVISAGTSDIPICEEALVTIETMGGCVERLYDVGVSGIHRLLHNRRKMDSSSVIVVVAGMDGALPSVVAGLTEKPVIAVPTSVGYGANFDGLAPLLTMLNTCANGVTVVNIDNGYGAGYSAAVINRIANQKYNKIEQSCC